MSATVELSEDTVRQLVDAALAARQHAYAPFSRYDVGAVILCRDGTVVPGCNVENSSYGLTVCAERTAIGAALAQGAKDFTAMAIVAEGKASPCGACRQALVEFNPDMVVIVAGPDGRVVTRTTAAELLPGYFRLDPDRG